MKSIAGTTRRPRSVEIFQAIAFVKALNLARSHPGLWTAGLAERAAGWPAGAVLARSEPATAAVAIEKCWTDAARLALLLTGLAAARACGSCGGTCDPAV